MMHSQSARRLVRVYLALTLSSTLWLSSVAQSAPATNQVVNDCSNDTELRNDLIAMQGGGGGTLTFACGAAAIFLVGGTLPNIDTNTIVDGGGLITLSGGNADATRIFTPSPGGTLTLKNITLTLGNASGGGGAGDGGCIWNAGVLILDNAVVENCHANEDGGGIFNYTGGRVSITNHSIIRNNSAVRDCGGVCDYGAWATLTNSTLSGNSATTRNVGGLGSVGVVTLTNALVISNSAAMDGGGLYSNISISLSNVTLAGNTALNDGGGLFNRGALKLSNTTVKDNTATHHGGGLSNAGSGVADIQGSRFDHNLEPTVLGQPWGGGAIYNLGILRVRESTFQSNSSGVYGGAIWQEAGSTAVSASLFAGNSVDGNGFSGGAIAIWNTSAAITNTTFTSNLAPGGGAVLSGGPSGRVTLMNATLYGNTASIGGAIQASARLTTTNSILANNLGGNCAGSVASKGYNLSSDNSCAAVFNKTGDWNNTPAYLGALTNNGGPTLTFMIFPPSKAINGGQCVGLTSDQRGVMRPVGVSCDIGAVEYQPGVPTPYLWLPRVAR